MVDERRLIEFVETDEPIKSKYRRDEYFVTVEDHSPTRVVHYRFNKESSPRVRQKNKFDDALDKMLNDANKKTPKYATISSGDLHQLVNADDGRNQMAMACTAMWDRATYQKHMVLHSPPSGFSTTLVIRYYF